MVDGIHGLSKPARDGVRSLVTRLWGAGRDSPLTALQAIEDALSALPQVKAVLTPGAVPTSTTTTTNNNPIGSPSSAGGRSTSDPHHHHHHRHHHQHQQQQQQHQHTYSRRELKRLRQACKSVSDALHSLRTLLHYLHALGMLPLSPPPSSSHQNHHHHQYSTSPSSSSSLGLSPKEPSKLMEASLRGAKGLGPLELSHAPSRVFLDLGLYRKKSHYNCGLIFQVGR